jgi:hypothetical protein
MTVSISTSMANVLAQGRAEREKLAQERSAAKLRDARSAVETLKRRNAAGADDAREERKAAAKKKIDEIKARIRMLQISGSVDPKVLAQLARELKSAVKMYGGSGGASGMVGGEQAGASPVATNTDTTISTAPAGGEAEGADVQTAVEDVELADDDMSADGTKNPEAAKSNDNPYQRMAEKAQADAGEQSRRGAAQQADRDFLSDVRNLANQIKTMAKRAQHQAETDPALRRDADDAAQAATEAMRAAENAGRDLGAAGVSLTV